jgi:hypothetical protein
VSKGWKAHEFLRKCLKLSLKEQDQLESPIKDGKIRYNRMLPDFCAVATGSWPLMIEHCRGRRQRRPRPDLGCSAIGWMEGSLCAEKPSIELYPKSVQSSPHLHPVTEYCGRVVNTHALYSGLPKLKSYPGDWLRFLMVSSVPPGKCQDSTLN